MELINKDTAFMALKIAEDDAKRAKAYATCGGIRKCQEIIQGLTGTQYEGVKSPKAVRVVQVEPWFKDGLTGRDVWRCSVCAQKISPKDKYCVNCGRKLEDRYE